MQTTWTQNDYITSILFNYLYFNSHFLNLFNISEPKTFLFMYIYIILFQNCLPEFFSLILRNYIPKRFIGSKININRSHT